MKAIKLIIVLIILTVFLSLTVIFGGRTLSRTYLDVHAAIKSRITNIFTDMPFDSFMKQSFFDYLQLTFRRHYNGVTILNDNRFILDMIDINPYIYERADAISVLNDYAERHGAIFIYVRVPNKVENNSLLPIAFSDNTVIEDANTLMHLIQEYSVDTLDLREEMERSGTNFTTAFFRGDHHWTADTTLWAFGRIIDHINAGYGYNISEMACDPGQYEYITFEKAFLGEESRTINNVTNYEDMTVLIPKFHTEFTIIDLLESNYMVNLDSGSFIDVFVPWINYEQSNSLIYGDLNKWLSGFTRYENAAAKENKSVLLAADSMGIPLATYFANAFTRVDNLYIQNGVNHRLWSAIENYDYDIVIFALSDVVINDNAPYWVQDRIFLGYPPG